MTTTHLIPLILLTSLATACTTKKTSGTGTSGGIPDTLLSIEGDAEDAYDMSLTEDYAAVGSDADTIDTAWQSFRATASADGASDATLTQVDQAIAGLHDAATAAAGPSATGRAANAVSAPMPDLFGLYSPVVPTPILALDYQGREIALDGMDQDFSAAAADVETMATTWGGVRSQVVDAGGTTESTDFDNSIANLRELAAGSDATALIDEANVALELVDAIEQVF